MAEHADPDQHGARQAITHPPHKAARIITRDDKGQAQTGDLTTDQGGRSSNAEKPPPGDAAPFAEKKSSGTGLGR